MSGKAKTLVIIAGMIVVYFIALNMVLNRKMAALEPETAGVTALENEMPVEKNSRGGITGELAVGNVVTFGAYEQDGDFSNGQEPLEWDVIGQKGKSYLLITHYVIDGKKFDDSSSDATVQANESKTAAQVTWAKSSIRAWLNGDFYTAAFNAEEQAKIRQTHNVTTDFRDFDTGYLGFSDTKESQSIGGGDTDDFVFLLSYEEFVKYFQPEESQTWHGRMQCGKAIVSPTDYAKNQGVYYRSLLREAFSLPADPTTFSDSYIEYLRDDVHKDYEENGYITSWITRSPGCYSDGTAVLMIISDYTCFSPSALKNEIHGIRPAIWVEG